MKVSWRGHRVTSFLAVSAVAALLVSLGAVAPAQAAAGDPTTHFTAVASGNGHSCGVTDGHVWCWGFNDRGQLGSPTPANAVDQPIPVPGISTATAVTAGAKFTCVLLADSSVRCWGADNVGQLGDGNTVDSSAPVAVAGLTGVTQLSAGRAHVCARTSVALYCWGSNGAGQLGTGDVRDAPFQLSSGISGQMSGANSVAVTDDDTVLVSDSARRAVWAFNADGTTADYWPTDAARPTPSYVAAVGSVGYVAVGTVLQSVSVGAAAQDVRTFDSAINGLAADDHGHLFVATGGEINAYRVSDLSRIWHVNVPAGATVTDLAIGTDPVTPPKDRLYVAVSGVASAVYYYDPVDGAVLNTFSIVPPGSNPCGLSLGDPKAGARLGTDGDGNVWVSLQSALRRDRSASSDYGCLDVYGPTGLYQQSWQSQKLLGEQQPFLSALYGVGLAGQSDGSMLVADASGNRMLRLVRDGSGGYTQDETWGSKAFSILPRQTPLASWASTDTTRAPVAPWSVQAGGDHTCVVLPPPGNNLHCWGANGAGEIGAPAQYADTSFPQAVAPGVAISPGGSHVCWLKTDAKTVNCLGDNSFGQTAGGSFQAVINGAAQTITALDLGATLSCAATSDGHVVCFGEGPIRGDMCTSFADMGISCSLPNVVITADPQASETGSVWGPLVGATNLSVGGNHSCVANSGSGNLYCWGRQPGGSNNAPDDDVAGPVRFLTGGGPQVTAGATVTDPLAADFSLPVHGVTSSNLTVKTASGAVVPVEIACADAVTASTPCSGESVWHVYLQPTKPLTSGAHYTVTSNPAGATAISAGGIDLPGVVVDVVAAPTQDERGPGVSYTWARTTTSKKKSYGGSFLWNNTPGASISTGFKGRSVTWYTATGPKAGKVLVAVDGVKKATVSLQSKRSATKVPEVVKGLKTGGHILTLTVLPTRADKPQVGGTVVLDAIKVGRTVISTPSTAAAWSTQSDAVAVGGGYALSTVKGSYATFTFEGTGVVWHTITGPDFGDAQLLIDGHLVLKSSTYSAGASGPKDVTIDGLPPGRHTLTVKVAGTGDGPRDAVAIDGFTAQEA